MSPSPTVPGSVPPAQSIHSALRLLVATVVLVITLRTWLVMGLIEPVSVAGSSMAPTLRGPFVTPRCPKCTTQFPVGIEFAAATSHAACPHCPEQRVPLADLPPSSHDLLWIDRTAFQWRGPRRWEVVVAHRPDDGSQLCVKRVVGLPGEKIRILHGDLWANQRVLTKSLAEQASMRHVVSREDGIQQRWVVPADSAWRWRQNHWQCTPSDAESFDWLRYVHSEGKPVTDQISYNASLSRQLNLVRDLMLTATLRTRGEGTLALEVDDGRRTHRVAICPSDRSIKLTSEGQTLWAGLLSEEVTRRLQQQSTYLVFSNFDRQLLLALDGQIELRFPLTDDEPPAGTAHPFAVGTMRLAASLEHLILYRDIYYTSQVTGGRPPNKDLLRRLGGDELFVLGDNGPVSFDSRSWGPLPGRLLLGKPLGVR